MPNKATIAAVNALSPERLRVLVQQLEELDRAVANETAGDRAVRGLLDRMKFHWLDSYPAEEHEALRTQQERHDRRADRHFGQLPHPPCPDASAPVAAHLRWMLSPEVS